MGTYAKVTVTLEIPATSNWGNNCQLDQVFKQAKDDVLGRLRHDLGQRGYTIIGEPKVAAVIAEEK